MAMQAGVSTPVPERPLTVLMDSCMGSEGCRPHAWAGNPLVDLLSWA